MIAVSVLIGLAVWLTPQVGEHPVPLPPDFDAAKCVECHAEKNQGKSVHTAVAAGCTSCHQVATDKDKTSITLLAEDGALCAMCHELKQEAVMHGPYKNGRCLACHDPHASEFPKVTRAETTTLCFSCHGVNQPGVAFDREKKLVTVLGGQMLAFDDYGRAVKIGLDGSGKSGHPIMGHPLTGKDPRSKDGILSCLSCHSPHSSSAQALVPAGTGTSIELCTQCHK